MSECKWLGKHQYFNLNDPEACCFACGMIPDFRESPISRYKHQPHIADEDELRFDAMVRKTLEGLSLNQWMGISA